MEKGYNLDNLEASFKEYLIAGKTQINAEKENQRRTTQKKALTNISVKNYLSDLRHFLGWLTFYLRASRYSSASFGVEELTSILTIKTLSDYKNYLVNNRLPVKTTNRRLSTLRKFCSFCISQGWLKENPAKRVSNVIPTKAGIQTSSLRRQETKNKGIPDQVRDDEEILRQFQQDLKKENLDPPTIKSYLADVGEFLQYANKN